MKKIFLSLAILAAVLGTFSCSNKTENENPNIPPEPSIEDHSSNDSTTLVMLEKNGVTLTEVTGSPTFPDSKLSIISPAVDTSLEIGPANFQFKIEGGNYELGVQSSDVSTKKCSNSSKGQHIHLILNNEPYQASYDTSYTTKNDLEAGNYVALAFISRSYHESLKHPGAYALTQFKVGEEEMDEIDLTAPHLFYSRPKGEYANEFADEVMLDFYLVNTSISEDGNYVKVTLNETTEFKITKWVPYLIKGLPVGPNTVQIALYDKNDNYIEGHFNSTTRTFNLVKN